jgi:hypothetical protein
LIRRRRKGGRSRSSALAGRDRSQHERSRRSCRPCSSGRRAALSRSSSTLTPSPESARRGAAGRSVDANKSESSNRQTAAWIKAELTGTWGSVGSLVPACFDAYVRVLHPAQTEDGRLVRWADVAHTLGKSVHPLVQWHALVGAAGPENLSVSDWGGLAIKSRPTLPTGYATTLRASCTEYCLAGRVFLRSLDWMGRCRTQSPPLWAAAAIWS